MLDYPIESLKINGVKNIMITSAPEHLGDIIKQYGDGSELNVNITYRAQVRPGGIAEAILLAEGLIGTDKHLYVALGDNIFAPPVKIDVKAGQATLVLADVGLEEAKRFGCPFLENGIVTAIVEKPVSPPSKYAVTGFYAYPEDVFARIRKLTPSERGELEVTDLNNQYVGEAKVHITKYDGWWSDAGTIETLFKAGQMAKTWSEHG